MTIDGWLLAYTELLNDSGVATARLDAEVLLADELSKDRSWLHAHKDYVLDDPVTKKLEDKLERRAKHEPLAYIRGRQEFYGRDFFVSPDTLTPRPETETMVSLALEVLKKHDIKTVADIGSGSGCILISLALESQHSEMIDFKGYEISPKALAIAQKNAQKHKANVSFAQCDITATRQKGWAEANMVVANLPYVPDDFNINLAASQEPPFAIFGGADGLDFYRIMFSKLSNNTKYVLTESLPPQHTGLTAIAKKSGFKLITELDFIQVFVRG